MHAALQWSGEVQFPPARESSTGWSRLDANGRAFAGGRDIPARPLGEVVQRGMDEPLPDLLLPASVVTLDGGLEACLTRRGEHHRDSELQTQSGHAAKAVRPVVSALKNRAVIELGVCGQAVFLPVLQQFFYSDFRGICRHDPARAQTAVQADAIEYVYVNTPLDDQVFDEIEAVELGSMLTYIVEIPPLRRRRKTPATTSIQRASALENAADCTYRRDAIQAERLTSLGQFAMDRCSPKLAQVRMITKLRPQPDHKAFYLRGRGLSLASAAPGTGPIHTVQTLACRMRDPALHGTQSDSKLRRHGPHRLAFANQRNHTT